MGHIGRIATTFAIALLLVGGAGVSNAGEQSAVPATFGTSVVTGAGGSLAS